VRDNTIIAPGSDAAVLRIKGDSLPKMSREGGEGGKAPSFFSPTSRDTVPEKLIAISVDCNGGYVYLDPYEGGKIAVAEACRNLACSGAVPLGATDNLNYANPHNPELFYQLKESVRGLAEACKHFNAPVTGGNCSLYNQSPNGPIDPTPTVAVVGIIEKPEHITTQWFKDEGDAILLLGEAVDAGDKLQGLGGSAYLKVVHGKKTGTPPRMDLEKEKALHDALRGWIAQGVIKSAHDCSEGGLGVALAESCISQQIARETPRLLGAVVDLSAAKDVRLDALLFGETQSRIVISTTANHAAKVLGQARALGIPAAQIGKAAGTDLKIKTAQGEFSWPLAELHDLWWNSIARAMK
jgi:phosphoribosylformylglycinamidine synthase